MKKILILDNKSDILDSILSSFSEKKIKPITANDRSRAIMMTNNENFSAIILNFKMPKIDGLDLIRNIRGHNTNKSTPIFLYTDAIDSDEIRRITMLGISNIFIKPFSTDALVTMVLDKILTKPKSPISYDATFINCCIHSTREIMEFYLGAKAAIEKPSIKTNSQTHGYATALIAICHKNEIRGSLSLTVDKGFIANLAKSIFGQTTITLDESMIGDMTGEMSNQLVGKLKAHLILEGYYITIGLPEVVVGENHRVEHKTKNPVLRIPIKCGEDNATIEICLTGSIEKGTPPEKGSGDLISGSIMF